MTVSGGVASTANDCVAGVASVLDDESVAFTEKVYDPSASELYGSGAVREPYEPVVTPGPSSLHSNVEPASVEWNVKVGDASLVAPDGPVSMTVSGGVASATPES